MRIHTVWSKFFLESKISKNIFVEKIFNLVEIAFKTPSNLNNFGSTKKRGKRVRKRGKRGSAPKTWQTTLKRGKWQPWKILQASQRSVLPNSVGAIIAKKIIFCPLPTALLDLVSEHLFAIFTFFCWASSVHTIFDNCFIFCVLKGFRHNKHVEINKERYLFISYPLFASVIAKTVVYATLISTMGEGNFHCHDSTY